jgi:hypothetical protein
MPSLYGAFCGVGVAIDYLKIWQAPKIEQLRPRQITVSRSTLEIVGRTAPGKCLCLGLTSMLAEVEGKRCSTRLNGNTKIE